VSRLIYSAITSLDGYVADENGNFDWGEPDEEVHSFINDLHREVGKYLYGRRLYEVMVDWETMNTEQQPPYLKDFAEIWQSRQGCVLENARDCLHRQDQDRARLQPGCGPRYEGPDGS
jgi:hypothetical protein